MSRPKTRRNLRLESLESRALLSSGGPTAQEQYMLEMVNMARTKPAEMASWLKSNLNANDIATIQHFGVNVDTELSAIANSTPVQPLAWNGTLGATAQEQSQYEADNQMQTHQGPGELSLEQRLDAAGFTNRVADGENSYAYAQSVDHAMKAFLIDWGVPDHGHRGNLLQPNTPAGKTYNQVGIGIVATGSNSQVGPFVMTQDFGRQENSLAQVVGVVYGDGNGNGLYDIGEGSGNASIVVTGQDGQIVAQTSTWDSGGYAIALAPGSYNVSALVNGTLVKTQSVTIGSDNVAVNFNLNQPWQGGTLAPAPAHHADLAPQAPPAPPAPQPPPPPPAAPPKKPTIDFQNPIVQPLVSNDASQVAFPDNQGLGVSWLSSWSWWRKGQ